MIPITAAFEKIRRAGGRVLLAGATLLAKGLLAAALASALMFAALLAMLASGCSDSVGADPAPLWLGRGGVLFTQGLALDNSGATNAIEVDGTGLAPIFQGAIPCPPRAGKAIYADVTVNGARWGIYLGTLDGSEPPRKLVGDDILPNTRPIFGIVDLSYDASEAIYVVNSSLYYVRADGSDRKVLASNVVNSTAALFSPNGDRVAFYAGAKKNELSVVDVATGAVTVLARNARPWSIENLDWSPDGRAIAFVGVADTLDSLAARNIYRVGADGSDLHPITFDSFEENHWPVWSPDGRAIAFLKGREVWTMSADGSGKRQITRESPWPYQIKIAPQWSPDGSMILFTAVAGNAVQGLLQVVDLATLRVNALATGAARGFWR